MDGVTTIIIIEFEKDVTHETVKILFFCTIIAMMWKINEKLVYYVCRASMASDIKLQLRTENGSQLWFRSFFLFFDFYFDFFLILN